MLTKRLARRGVEIAGKLHGVFERLFAVIERVLDAVAQSLGDDLVRFRAQRAANGVAAERQHQAGGFAPPDAEIDDFVESAGRVGELAFVNDESGIVLAGEDRRE